MERKVQEEESEVPDGLAFYTNDWLTQRDIKRLLTWLRTDVRWVPAWSGDGHADEGARRVAQYGFAYHYTRRCIVPAAHARIPPIVQRLVLCHIERMLRIPEGYFNQMLVNRYAPGQSIAPHTDLSHFGGTIVSLSLGAPATVRFVNPLVADAAPIDLQVTEGVVYVLQDAARSVWTHATLPQAAGTRISLTFRHVAAEVVVRE